LVLAAASASGSGVSFGSADLTDRFRKLAGERSEFSVDRLFKCKNRNFGPLSLGSIAERLFYVGMN